MTLRETLGPAAHVVRERLEQVLDSEDGIVILVDRSGATTFYHGFGASGCQLELAAARVDAELREIAGDDPVPRDGSSCREMSGVLR